MDGEASEGVAPAQASRASGLAPACQSGRSTRPSRVGGPRDRMDVDPLAGDKKGAVVLLRAVEAVLGPRKTTLRGLSAPSALMACLPQGPLALSVVAGCLGRSFLSSVPHTWFTSHTS
jgi:hypothetical protein